ncbi:MAG: YeeE/YedE thiosulfate transporter family protein [Pirellulaceae bacterium]
MSSASQPDKAHPLHAASAEAPAAPTPTRRKWGRARTGETPEATTWPWLGASSAKLAQAVVFGLIFGFLLQKGGVAKFDILVGVLLLENFVVVQVMLSAIIVGMIGVYLLNRMGLLETQIKETVLGANVIGGLIFGIGFGLIAYCPGTSAAALGQGNLDAIAGIFGMVLGSYLFALGSQFTDGTVSKWGQLGKVTLADLTRLRTGIFIAMFLPWLVVVLLGLELVAAHRA